jgi:hypothetical protein
MGRQTPLGDDEVGVGVGVGVVGAELLGAGAGAVEAGAEVDGAAVGAGMAGLSDPDDGPVTGVVRRAERVAVTDGDGRVDVGVTVGC